MQQAIFLSLLINRLVEEAHTYQLYSIDFHTISDHTNIMFERQENPTKVGDFQQFPAKALFQTIIKVWCKSGVKSEPVQDVWHFTPKHSKTVDMHEFPASMVKWHHTSLVRTSFLVSKGWRHQING